MHQHTGFDHQSAKIPAKTCSMFPGHSTVLQKNRENIAITNHMCASFTICTSTKAKINRFGIFFFYSSSGPLGKCQKSLILVIEANIVTSPNVTYFRILEHCTCSIISRIRLKPPFHSLSPPRRKLLE